jgi:hypothetical protein
MSKPCKLKRSPRQVKVRGELYRDGPSRLIHREQLDIRKTISWPLREKTFYYVGNARRDWQ